MLTKNIPPRFPRFVAGAFLLSLAGCGHEVDTDDDLPALGWDEPAESSIALAYDEAIDGPWDIPDAVSAIGDRQYVNYDGAGPWNNGNGCAPWLRPGTAALRTFLRDNFEQAYSIGGFNCRAINGNSNLLSQHGTGRALDIYISTVDGRANNGAGDEVAHWLIENAEAIGVQYIIWDKWTWRANRNAGQKDRAYGGSHPHHNHIHMELSIDGAEKDGVWFDGVEPVEPVEPPVEPTAPPFAGLPHDSVGFQDAATGEWHLYGSDASSQTFYFGDPADIPFAGDWSCNGTTSPGLYRESAGYLFLRDTNTQGVADTEIYYGNPGDKPLAGDWNGDGCESIGVFRPSNNTFYLRNDNVQGNADVSAAFGDAGDIPVTGDWNGDGTDTIGVYRPSTASFYLRDGVNSGSVMTVPFGAAGDVPVIGDWNGDGFDGIGVYRASDETFYLSNTLDNVAPTHITFSLPASSSMTPVVGRWGF